MKLSKNYHYLTVSLSKRNLDTLVQQYTTTGHAQLHRAVEDGAVLIVSVENDDAHYADRPEARFTVNASVAEVLDGVPGYGDLAVAEHAARG